jgi:hypothetical protein
MVGVGFDGCEALSDDRLGDVPDPGFGEPWDGPGARAGVVMTIVCCRPRSRWSGAFGSQTATRPPSAGRIAP